MMSANNRLMLEPYTGVNKIQSSGEKTGFATIKQKTAVIGLKLMADAKIPVGKELVDVKKGQTVYFVEEVLHSNEWAKKTYAIADKDLFILGEASQVVAFA